MIARLPPLDSVDVIIPVPLHIQKLREREFNQSLLLADHIGRRLAIPVAYTNLVRTVPTPAQTTLSRKSRPQKPSSSVCRPAPDAIVNKRILLIDDVFTTGTTVNECAKALRRAGSCRRIRLDVKPNHGYRYRPRSNPGSVRPYFFESVEGTFHADLRVLVSGMTRRSPS